jgi:hypothetical protein
MRSLFLFFDILFSFRVRALRHALLVLFYKLN